MNTKKMMDNLYRSCFFFQVFKQPMYLKCVLLQLSLMEFYKKSKSPIWTLFEESPELFIEVKGEWSLSKITGLIHSKGIHLDVDLSSKYYLLTKEANEKKNHIEDYNFFGYKKFPKKWKVEDEEVKTIKLIVKNLLRRIIQDENFLYPQIQSFHYPKISNINLLRLEDDLEN